MPYADSMIDAPGAGITGVVIWGARVAHLGFLHCGAMDLTSSCRPSIDRQLPWLCGAWNDAARYSRPVCRSRVIFTWQAILCPMDKWKPLKITVLMGCAVATVSNWALPAPAFRKVI